LESRQRWFDAGLGDRIERNPPDRVRRSGAGKNSLLRPLRRGKGGCGRMTGQLAHRSQIFSRISGRCGLDKGLPLDPVCRQQIDGKFRSQILTGEPAQTTNFRPLVFDYFQTIADNCQWTRRGCGGPSCSAWLQACGRRE